jgi:FkbM family methyltransferase
MLIRKIVFLIGRMIDKSPTLTNLFFKNIYLFKFLYPLEKDYFGINLILKKNFNYDFVDIGANYGQSAISFRKLGFKNKILMFEANLHLKPYLNYVKNKYKNILYFDYGLSNKNIYKKFFIPKINGNFFFALGSFEKQKLIEQLNVQFAKTPYKIIVEKATIKKLDQIKIKNFKPGFIKIDIEGYEINALLGMKNIIKKFRPIFLIEGKIDDKNYIKKILRILGKGYKAFFYDFLHHKILQIKFYKKNNIKKNLSVRNIFFVPTKVNFL